MLIETPAAVARADCELLIEEARRWERRRRLRRFVLALAAIGLIVAVFVARSSIGSAAGRVSGAFAGAAGVGSHHSTPQLPSPCALLTAGEVQTVLGLRVVRRVPGGNGKFLSCTWSGPAEGYFGDHPSVMLMTYFISRVQFVRDAHAFEVGSELSGLGSFAFTAVGGSTLQVWRNGIAWSFEFHLVSASLRAKKDLAQLAIGHV